MPKRINKIVGMVFLLLLLIAGAPAAFGQGQSERDKSFQKGKLEAEANVKDGIYLLKGWGLSERHLSGGVFGGSWPSRNEIYESILKEKYRISYEQVGGCLIDEETEAYVNGYNEVSLAAIETKYGEGILDKVRKQADQEFESKYGAQERELNKRFQQFIESIKSLPKTDNQ